MTTEFESYHERILEKWLRRPAVLGTDEHKPFLEIAPVLIFDFRINSITEAGSIEPTYYSQESFGIAVRILLATLHYINIYAKPDEIFAGNSRQTEK